MTTKAKPRPKTKGPATQRSGRKRQHLSGADADHSRQLPRLRRIEGQVRGLQQMIEDGRYCIDIAYQINAVIAALRRVQADMLRDHLKVNLRAAATDKPSEAERSDIVDEIAALIARML